MQLKNYIIRHCDGCFPHLPMIKVTKLMVRIMQDLQNHAVDVRPIIILTESLPNCNKLSTQKW